MVPGKSAAAWLQNYLVDEKECETPPKVPRKSFINPMSATSVVDGTDENERVEIVADKPSSSEPTLSMNPPSSICEVDEVQEIIRENYPSSG